MDRDEVDDTEEEAEVSDGVDEVTGVEDEELMEPEVVKLAEEEVSEGEDEVGVLDVDEMEGLDGVDWDEVVGEVMDGVEMLLVVVGGADEEVRASEVVVVGIADALIEWVSVKARENDGETHDGVVNVGMLKEAGVR